MEKSVESVVDNSLCPRIWKVSHGWPTKGLISDEDNKTLLDNNYVGIGWADKPEHTQRQRFREIKETDYFYLIRKRQIVLLGKLTKDEPIIVGDNLDMSSGSGIKLNNQAMKGWLFRKFEPILTLPEPSGFPVINKNGGMPSSNSTVQEVGTKSLADFEKQVLIPIFHKNFQELNPALKYEVEREKDKQMKNIQNMPKNQILYGPPGTGKTFITAEKAVQICSSDFEINDAEDKRTQIMAEYNKLVKDGRISFVTFHQSYGYEEFVEGLKPKLDKSSGESSDDETKESGQVNYHIPDGVFKDICKKAKKDSGNNYVIIIDEINRGNISKIFGELITLIEEDKREGKQNTLTVTLPYSKYKFSVPSNVYIIGTMNTADRSLANVDTALRRRFHFEPMMPDPYVLSKLENINGIDVKRMLEKINQRIEVLYDREHTIGHAYFTKLLTTENDKFDELQLIFTDKVIPLLEEYFFDDWQKIRLVLGDNQKSQQSQFINIINNNDGNQNLFGKDQSDMELSPSYVINSDAFGDENSYIGIYESLDNEQ